VEAHGHASIVGIRLKIENQRISEMEAIVIRSTARGSFSDIKGMVDRPLLTQPLTAPQRRDRDTLITVANSYFEGMEKGTDKNTPFDKDCQRIENGVITANHADDTIPIRRESCGAQFATGFTKIITNVRERRFPIVDEERGLVLAIIRFDHNGRKNTIAYSDGSVHPVNTPFDEPFAFTIAELFKIVDGKIRQIEALVLNVPYGMPTGWVQ
jgi:ribosomal protein S27AE